MTRFNAANNWETTINMVGGLGGGAGDLTLTVADSTGHPAVPFKITIDDEICNVTAVSTNDFTLDRGQEGTTRAAHDDGAKVENLFTAEVQNELWDEVDGHIAKDETDDVHNIATYMGEYAVDKSGDTLTGNLNFDSNEAQNAKIVDADIQSYVENPVTSTGTGAQTLNLNAGTLFEHTVDANTATTFSLSNVALGKSFTLVVHQHADGPAITLDWTILWSGGSVPEMMDGETNVFIFMRIAAGTGTWLGHHVGDTYGDGST